MKAFGRFVVLFSAVFLGTVLGAEWIGHPLSQGAKIFFAGIASGLVFWLLPRRTP